MNKYLIINADDCGLSPSVNQGVVELHQMGYISSVTLMVNMPGFEDATRVIKENPNLGVGLHFNLTYGSPISDPENVPSLVNAGGEFSFEIERWKKDDVVTELSAQWSRFKKTGLQPTHIDSHQHIQKYPCVYEPMVLLAQKRNLPMRRMGQEPTIEGMQHPLSADRFILDFYFKGDGESRLEQHLKELQPGITELMCHPGHVDDYVKAISTWTDVREKEFEVFCNHELVSMLQKLDITLIHYGQINQVDRDLTRIFSVYDARSMR